MLYDPKWEAPVKADPLTLPALVAWLAKHPADKIYCYSDGGHCLAAQYNKAIGRAYCMSIIGLVGDPDSTWIFDDYLERIAVGEAADQSDWTFGGALERAKKFAAAS